MQNLEHFTAANLGFGAIFPAGGEAQSTNKWIIETGFFFFISSLSEFFFGEIQMLHNSFD